MDADPGPPHDLLADALEQVAKARVPWIGDHMRAQQAPDLRSAPPLSADGALAAALLACSGIAWVVTARLVTADMQVGLLTSPLGSFVGTWAAMMAAMMLPFSRIYRSRPKHRTHLVPASTGRV